MSDYPLPIIDLTKCDSCGNCAQDCPSEAVHMKDGFPILDKSGNCTYCGTCEEVCPAGAISLEYEIG